METRRVKIVVVGHVPILSDHAGSEDADDDRDELHIESWDIVGIRVEGEMVLDGIDTKDALQVLRNERRNIRAADRQLK